ncbi:MAG TPA: GDSL-type esterase/lipase family protein [Puia sp.]|nr:GDSL-type esterase/lipase family protein [Puia sp.]
MKKILSTLLAFAPALLLHAQTPKVDSNYRPPTYGQRLALFKSYPNSTRDVIFLGNSITAGVDWDELLQLPEARNRGISGDLTFGVLQRLDEVIEGHPAKVFILIGINDIGRNIADSLILRNDEWMIRRIQAGSPATKIYFQTLLPVNNTFTQHPTHYNKDQHILAVNQGIKQLTEKYHITLVDLHPHFLDKDGRLDAGYTMDGLHLNDKGYQVWKTVLKSYL